MGDTQLNLRRRAAQSLSNLGRQRGGVVSSPRSHHRAPEGILVEGRHPLSVVFRGSEKPLKLSFVASNSICESLSHGDAPLGGIVGHIEITHEVSERSVSVIILPCTNGSFQ